jgi:SAM-dependent methyltransferase
MQWFQQQGCLPLGVDQSSEALASASAWGPTLQADLEHADWPLLTEGVTQQFDAVVVTNYLWRALFPRILQSLKPGGVLIYETFAAGNASVGKPSRADFLLQSGELLTLCAGLRVVAFEDGFLNSPERFVQRIVAIRVCAVAEPTAAPGRYLLSLK